MTRTDHDSWDPASSVGATATLVAAGRAMASAEPDSLIDDPYAAPLVRAVGIDFFTRLVDGDVDLAQIPIPDASPERVRAMIDRMAVRTKFFDDYLAAATAGGVRQAVILASGLDARAFRLPWPEGTVVYELDQPEVVAFKTDTLTAIGATPKATRRTIGIDLRDDWPTALRAAGFDSTEPTAWLAEGLLVYLPPTAQDRLFDDITALSAPGSSVGTEYAPGIMTFDAEKAREMSAPMREHGLDIDMASLVYAGQRSHVMEYLRQKGWRVTGSPSDDLLAEYGLPAPTTPEDSPLGEIVYVSATLPG
jgi:methyltransferase (TIGR00027 family)